MPTLYKQAKTSTTTRTNKQGAHDIQDAALFAFIAPLAPTMTALYSRGNDTKDSANLFCFVGAFEHQRVFVRAEFVSNVYDMRLAVIHAATYAFLVTQAKQAYTAQHGVELDTKSARAIADAKIQAAYKNVIERACAASLFDVDENTARMYANGSITNGAPFATLANELPAVETRGVTVTMTEHARRAANVPKLEIDIDAALAAQFNVAEQTQAAQAN